MSTTYMQKLGVALCACNLIARANGESRGHPDQPGWLNKQAPVSQKTLSQKTMWKSDSRLPRSLHLSVYYVLAHPPTHYLSPSPPTKAVATPSKTVHFNHFVAGT